MGLFEQLFGRKSDVPIGNPPNFEPMGPEADVEESPVSDISFDALEGMALALQYRDAAGQPSQRVVLCRQYIPPPPGYINGHCQLRNAPRSFRLDRIVELVNLSTGEVMDAADFRHLFSGAEEQDRLRQFVREIGSGVKVLVFLANVDGTLHDAEQRIIKRFAIESAARLFPKGFIAEKTVDLWVDGLRPTRDIARRATIATSRDMEAFPYLARAMLDVVKADGRVDAKEEKVVRAFIASVRKAHDLPSI